MWKDRLLCNHHRVSGWRHQIESFSALLALCVVIPLANGEFPSQRPVTRSFAVFFDLRLSKRLSKQSRRWWFETTSRSLLRYCNGDKTRTLCIFLEIYSTIATLLRGAALCYLLVTTSEMHINNKSRQIHSNFPKYHTHLFVFIMRVISGK